MRNLHSSDIGHDVLLISPFERPCARVVNDGAKAGALPFLDIGRDEVESARAIAQVKVPSQAAWGVRIPEGVSLSPALVDLLRGNASLLMHASPADMQLHEGFTHLVQATSLEEALSAQERGADGVVLKGAESGGRVGETNSFILLQQVATRLRVPFWMQGGMGPHGAAAAVFAGARGVVYDAQLALLPSVRLPAQLRGILRSVNGSETAVAGGYRYLRHNLLPDLRDGLAREDVIDRLSQSDAPLLAGEDAALADLFLSLYGDLPTLVSATANAIDGHLRQAQREKAFDEGSPFAREYGLRYPILQGPMTRVSDAPGFAAAVAEAGALPSIALAVMTVDDARPILEQTRDRLGLAPWSVGLLGFLPPDAYRQQAELVLEMAPRHVLIAGGRPDQAKMFESRGIGAFLHCPTFRLLEHFLKEGARRLVFEGRECGGHVGPLSSMTLWEGQISLALESEAPENLSLVFAGGLHDAHSTAMLAVMCAPLAARGAKLGVLMGTAYLFTDEIVREGAILPRYQDLVVGQADTVLLQTGPGHVTRCLHTPYVDVLERERLRLQREGRSQQEIFIALEGMNVGHLRIASKGKKRIDGALSPVDERVQHEEGMYMVGDVVRLRHATMPIARLHRDIADNTALLQQAQPRPAGKTPRGESCDIAIIGVAGIFPGALTAEEFWSNILQGKDCVTEVPDSRWRKDIYYDANARGAAGEKTNSKWGGFVPDFHFDPVSFGIPPQALGSIDPAQIASLLVASQALKDAGCHEANADSGRTSVIFGVEPGGDISAAYGLRILLPQLTRGEALERAVEALPKLTEDSFPGVLGNIVTGRISNRLDFGGQNFTVDAACASSLAAVDAAIKELRYGECDLAIAGGVDFHNGINDYLMFSSTHALSSKGRCFTFSDGADGIALGEAAAAVVLKRHEDAIADGDRIYAVIRGIAGASDGRSLGLTAPRKQGQRRALERAYRRAGVSPRAIGLLEAHGTGTVAGDQTELTTLESVFAGAGSDRAGCVLGSVKTQIGHTKCAAGMASLIKAAYSIDQAILPATLHLDRPNRAYRQERSSFAFLSQANPWFGAHRMAGVSAFGFGGTNYHVVLDQARDSAAQTPSAPDVWPSELFLFRGADAAAARRQIDRLANYLDVGRQVRLADVAFSHHEDCDPALPLQVAVLAGSLEELRLRLDMARDGRGDPRGVFLAANEPEAGEIAFLFPGQGSQFPRMGADLFTYFPQTRQWIESDDGLQKRMFPSRSFSDNEQAAQEAALTDTQVAQPALGAVALAATQILRELGVRAQHVAGHSYGELVALCDAGCFAAGDLLSLSRRRAESVIATIDPDDPGAMLAVEADESRVREVLGEFGELDLANLNAPDQTVLAGSRAAIAQARTTLAAHRLRVRELPVACAFHSRARAGAAALFAQSLASQHFSAPNTVTVWSNESAAPYAAQITSAEIAQALARQIVSPVRFAEMIRAMYARGVRTFIEAGAGGVLSGLVNRILEGKPVRTLPVSLRDAPALKGVLAALARLAVSGVAVDPSRLYTGRRVNRLDLDDHRPLPKSLWLVNGHCARPLFGPLPAQAFDPSAAIDLTPPASSSRAAGSEADSLGMYFDTLNRFIEAQRDVMLEHLGAGADVPRRSSISATPPTPPARTDAVIAQETRVPHVQIDAASVEARLRDMISERTGYPHDMLDAGLDLEADLGIDSIKRVELLAEISAQLGLSREGGNQTLGEETSFLDEVSRIKTLRGISTWLADHARKLQGRASAEPAGSPPAAPQPSAALPAAVDADFIERRLRSLICERTGYPDDMLDAGLDLEADLGIDSIKRVELLAQISGELGLAGVGSAETLGEDTTSFLDEVSRIKTLRGISTWLAQYLMRSRQGAVASGDDVQSPPPPEDALRAAAPPIPSAVPLRTFDVRYTPQLLRGDRSVDLQGKTFHVIGAPEDMWLSLSGTLAGHGIALHFIDRSDVVAGMRLESDGVVFFSDNSAPYDDIRALLWSLQACGGSHIDTVLVVQCATPPLLDGEGRYIAPAESTGAAGFLVSLRWEWARTRIIRSLVFHDALELEPGALAGRLRDEIFSLAEPMAQPVAYVAGVRHVRQVVPSSSQNTATLPLSLEKEAVILVVGGAKGITSWFAEGLASRYGCRLVVVGRSAWPSGEDPFPLLDTAQELRKTLLHSRPAGTSAREIENEVRQLLADKAMRRNLAALKAAGSDVSYRQADVTDRAQVEGVVEETMRRFGRIDGVLFGAGVLDDKFLSDKNEASLAKVYQPKVAGAENVLAAVHAHGEPRFFVFFSSLSSAVGNRGQTVYSAANDYLDVRALALNAARPGQYLSVNWGPWEGAGMIDATLQKHLEGMGVHAIQRRQGVDFLFDALGAGKQAGQVVAMCVNDDALYWKDSQ